MFLGSLLMQSSSVGPYTVTVNVSGLSGSTTPLVLQNNGGDDLSLTSDGAHSFSTLLDSGDTYSVSVLTQPTGPGKTCTVTGASGTIVGANVVGIGVSCVALDPISPEVSSVFSLNSTTVRVIYSESVNAAEAQTIAAYKVVDTSSVAGACSDNTNFTGSTQSADFTILSISGTGATYDITLSAGQTTGKNYTLVVDKTNLHDLAETTNALGCPNYGDFVGQEQLKVGSVSCISNLKDVIITFSKPVTTGVNTDFSPECNSTIQCARRFKLLGATDLGNIQSVRLLNGTVCNGAAADSTNTKFCLTHTNDQGGGIYTVIAANNTDGDNFNNSGCGWGGDCSIEATSPAGENVQANPNDRRSFTGCGTPPGDLGSGPISSDPFADSSNFGYLMSFNNKVYIGPNTEGNTATRFNPDATGPQSLTFEFTKDTSSANSSGTHTNSATTRDGGTAVPPYVSMGHTGCTSNNADLLIGCGPDNEDGRGLFVSGTISGTEYLFITGGRSSGDNDYLYYTTDTDTLLNFNYIDLQATFDNGDSGSISGNKGTESIEVFNNKVYWMLPGDRSYRPYYAKLNNLNSDSINGTDSVFMRFRYMTGIGAYSSTKPNYADRIGGTMYTFGNKLYLGNSGSVRDVTNSDYDCPEGSTSASTPACINDGGLIRSTNTDPGRCTGADNCPDWVDITPSAGEFTNYFSKIIEALADLTPSQRPIPAFAEFNSNLYFIRNACTTNMINRSCTPGSPCTDDGDPANRSCPAGNEVPQLWKCVPATSGSATDCDSGDWSLVAENGVTDRTNFGNTNNSKLSMLIKNGSYLYVGFDNTSGVEIWRTKAGVTNPASESDFEQVGGAGLGDTTNNLELFSAISILQLGTNYLYISSGKNSNPVKLYVQQD